MKPAFLIFRTIRLRLTALYTVILAVILALAGSYVFYAVELAAQETVDQDLRARLTAVRETLPAELKEAKDLHLDEAIEDQAVAGPAGVWLEVADDKGNWIHQSEAMRESERTAPSVRGLPVDGETHTIRVRGKRMRVLIASLTPFVVEIGMPMGEFAEMHEKLRWTLGLGVPPLILLACVAGYWLSGKALKPVDEIATTVQRIGSRNLTERVRLSGTGDEIDRLAETMNRMLARLESAFRLVTQVTADASHELRTPVAIIRTTGEVVRAGKRTVEAHEAAWDQVVLQTERMSTLIDDLLLLARADAGTTQSHFELLNLAELVRFAVDDMHVLAEAAGVALIVSTPDVCTMQGDPDAIRRLVLTLLDNAIKYTDPGGQISVVLQVFSTNDERHALLEVHDTGIGIPSEDLPHLFDRFYRVSTDRSRMTGGSGLGLSIAEWLTNLHGGVIGVESTLGQGSTFRVQFPMVS